MTGFQTQLQVSWFLSFASPYSALVCYGGDDGDNDGDDNNGDDDDGDDNDGDDDNDNGEGKDYGCGGVVVTL